MSNALRYAEFEEKDNEFIKKEGKFLRFVAAIDQKEAELIEKNGKTDKRVETLKKNEEALAERKADVAVLKKQNQDEAVRLKKVDKDYINRDDKLTSRETLFNKKITGGK